ncbi:hypothetical protein KIN20_011988 [Parelaphostrongylus tenuis]|uniref:Uncharacterized protein n=1 Tax=Parelaphostrongylus tenuis TaxID=148309 RepID=A0AAD5N0R9_PARTN|nr:hypothetical protein KIN20_011988 [Parelaphostrongylus tenuis]
MATLAKARATAPLITDSESKGGEHVQSKPLEIMDDPDVLKFDDGVQVHLDHVRKSIQKGAYLYGPLASFCIVHYIPKVLHSADWAKVHYLESKAFSMQAPLFAWRRKSQEMPPSFRKLLDYEVSIIPIHWVDHWFLAILQWLSRDDECSNKPVTPTYEQFSFYGEVKIAEASAIVFEGEVNQAQVSNKEE